MLAQLQAVNSSIVITPADAVRGAVLFGAGDAFAQAVERHMDRHSVVKRSLVQLDRLVKATVVGSVYGGAILPAVYQLAEGLLPGRTAVNVVLKTAISCGLLSTGGNYYSLVARRLLGPAPIGERLEQRVQRCVSSVHRIFAHVVLDDLKVWPLYDLLCFSVVPPHLRPTATAVVSVCWHSYVSFVANRREATARENAQTLKCVEIEV